MTGSAQGGEDLVCMTIAIHIMLYSKAIHARMTKSGHGKRLSRAYVCCFLNRPFFKVVDLPCSHLVVCMVQTCQL